MGKLRRVVLLLSLLFCGAAVVAGLVHSKAEATWVPDITVELPNAVKPLKATAVNRIGTDDICVEDPAPSVCPMSGDDGKLAKGWMPDLSATYIPTGAKGAPSGVASLDGDSRLAQYPSGAAPKYLTPANPTNLTSTSYRMFGLGSTIAITPAKSGKVRWTISWYASGVGLGTNTYKLSYGSGAAPANGSAASGTVVGGVYSGGASAAAIDAGAPTPAPILRDVIVMSLAPGTAYWFDVQGARGSRSTAVGMTLIEATLEELPY